MMKNIIWENLFLKKNPFALVPEKDTEDIFWAGLSGTKEKFEKVFASVYSSKESRVILNVSRWGGGKTHSAFFFTNSNNIPFDNSVAPICIVINSPKEGNTASVEFFKLIIEDLGVDFLSRTIRGVRNSLGDNETLELLKSYSKNDIIARILWYLGDADEDKSFEASELLFNNPSASQRKLFRLTRGLEGTSDRFRLVGTLFRFLSKYDESGLLEHGRKIFLWMDEIESLILYTSKQYIPFTQALRELLDYVSTNFYLFLNFSLSDYDDLRTLEFIIGKALYDRITDQVFFEEPDVNEGLNYIKDVLSYWRSENFDKENIYFPFVEEQLLRILTEAPQKLTTPLMPRTLNKWCLAILSKANELNLLDTPVNDLIDVNAYNVILN